jgi:hypothetical protein
MNDKERDRDGSNSPEPWVSLIGPVFLLYKATISSFRSYMLPRKPSCTSSHEAESRLPNVESPRPVYVPLLPLCLQIWKDSSSIGEHDREACLITKACRRLRGPGLPLAAQANAANGAASVTRLALHKLFGAIKFDVIDLQLLGAWCVGHYCSCLRLWLRRRGSMSGVDSVMSGKRAKQLVCLSPALPIFVTRLPHLRMLCDNQRCTRTCYICHLCRVALYESSPNTCAVTLMEPTMTRDAHPRICRHGCYKMSLFSLKSIAVTQNTSDHKFPAHLGDRLPLLMPNTWIILGPVGMLDSPVVFDQTSCL